METLRPTGDRRATGQQRHIQSPAIEVNPLDFPYRISYDLKPTPGPCPEEPIE